MGRLTQMFKVQEQRSGGPQPQPHLQTRQMVMIATPCYGAMLHMSTHNWIIAQVTQGHHLAHVCLGHESLIPRARNKLISIFYGSPEFSHLMWLDADIELAPDALSKLLAHDKDVVGVGIGLRGERDGRPILNLGSELSRSGDLVETEWLGAAAMLVTRKAVESVLADAESYLDDGSHTRGNPQPLRVFDIFQTGIVNGRYLSEDQAFCRRLRDKGHSIYVDITIRSLHHGGGAFANWKEITNG